MTPRVKGKPPDAADLPDKAAPLDALRLYTDWCG